MKFLGSAIFTALAVSSCSAFTEIKPKLHKSKTALNYNVGIVGATGAVGKEIRQCLEDRGKLPVTKLRIFGSPRRNKNNFLHVQKIFCFGVQQCLWTSRIFLVQSKNSGTSKTVLGCPTNIFVRPKKH